MGPKCVMYRPRWRRCIWDLRIVCRSWLSVETLVSPTVARLHQQMYYNRGLSQGWIISVLFKPFHGHLARLFGINRAMASIPPASASAWMIQSVGHDLTTRWMADGWRFIDGAQHHESVIGGSCVVVVVVDWLTNGLLRPSMIHRGRISAVGSINQGSYRHAPLIHCHWIGILWGGDKSGR